jgi:hypothetical protein
MRIDSGLLSYRFASFTASDPDQRRIATNPDPINKSMN